MRGYGATNYDDYDRAILQGENISSGLFSPFTFIVLTLSLVLWGLFTMYSASYDDAVRMGRPHYWFLLWQALGLLIGLILSLIQRFIPLKGLRRSFILFTPFSFLVIGLMFLPSFRDGSYLVLGGVRVVSASSVAALSIVTLIAGSTSYLVLVERRGIWFSLIALLVSLTVIGVTLTAGAGAGFLLTLTLSFMMYASGARKRYAIFSFLFLSVTVLFIAFVSPRLFSETASSLYPVSDGALYNESLYQSRLAIHDGGFLGMGLGRGIYKLGVIEGVRSEFIFASLYEETGLIGAIILSALFFLYLLVGMRTSSRAYRKGNYPVSGATLGFASFIVTEAVLNMLYVSGYFPFPGLVLPFFSYCPGDEAIFILLSSFIYRYAFLIGRPQLDKK